MQFLKNAKKLFNIAEVEDDERGVYSRQGLFLYTITSKVRGQGNAMVPLP